MAAVEVTISGVLFDKLNRTTQNVVLIGEASLTGVGVGGGPIIPPPMPPGGGGPPPGIWPGPGPLPHPEHPIVIPIPPGPNVPPPGSPPVIVGGTQPVQPITPPAAIIVEYPGVGKVVVPQPTATGPEPKH